MCCFKDIKKLPTKYDANINSEIITMTSEDYGTQLGWKVSAQIQKILLFTGQCAAHSKNTTFLTNRSILFFPANCISQSQNQVQLQKAFCSKDCCHVRWQATSRSFVYEVGCPVCLHFTAEAWKLITLTTTRNCFT